MINRLPAQFLRQKIDALKMYAKTARDEAACYRSRADEEMERAERFERDVRAFEEALSLLDTKEEPANG